MTAEIRPPSVTSTLCADHYLVPFAKDSTEMIHNVQTEVQVCALPGADYGLPLTVNHAEYANSYVCSPYTALVPYCLEELAKLDNRLLKGIIRQFIRPLDGYLKKRQINKVIHANNWLLSTNLYPPAFSRADIDCFIAAITVIHREQTLIFRSLNPFSNGALIDGFKDAGCIMVPTRQVYIFDKSINDYSKTHNYKIDKKLLEKTDYHYVPETEISTADFDRIVELYNLLYVNKYSRYNPQFTARYIASIIEHPNFYLEGFRNRQGILDAVGGRFTIGSTTSLPIVGYDTAKPMNLGLYRLVLISTLLHAEKNHLTFNASSGAPSFKRLRGAAPFIEYSAVYSKHLPASAQRLWKQLATVLEYTFVPIMKKYQL